jgi:general secretion pathway protein J
MMGDRLKKLKILHSAFCISRRGFTLLELMVSLTLIAFIVVIITGATRISFDAVEKGEKRIDSLERVRTSMNIINSQIQSQSPLTFEEDGEEKYYFQGDTESMQISSNYSIWSGQKGYIVVRYKVEPDGNGKLMLTATEHVIGMDSKRETKLFHAMDSIYFEYFFKDPTEENGIWVEKWTDTVNIPEKVNLHLVNGGRDFSMIIPMRTSGSLARKSSNQDSNAQIKDSKSRK